MNGPFQIAQANIAGQSGGKQPARIVKIAKPFSEQAVVVPLSYDGSVKADLSAIAGEKITLVHIGEKLIILFDNKSTITLEPFFDSTGKPLDGIQVEVSPGRDLTSAEFAQLFPVTEDNSILPASGEGSAGGATASGAHFTTVGVDPLSAPNPLDLLGQEELPNFVINNLLGPLQVDDTPTFDADQSFRLDEDSLTKPPALREGNHDSALGDDEGDQSFNGSLHYNFRFDGPASTNPIMVNVGALNALGLTSGHQPITFTWDANTFTLTGTADDGQGHQTTILKLQIDPATATSAGNDHPFTLQLLGPIDHPGHDDPSTPATETSFEDNIVLNVQFTITDSNGTATPGTITIDIDDDSPAIISDATVIRTVDEDDILTPWSIGTSPNTSPEGAGDESVTQGGGGLIHPAVVTGSVAGVVSFGADGEGAFGFTADAADYFTSLGLYSKQTALPENGIQLTYTVTEDATNHTITLHGVEPGNTGNPVFDFVLDTQTGDFTFKLYDELVHVAGGGQNTDLRAGDSSIPYLDFGHIITATDGDGDTITLDDQLHIIVKDDVPETRISVNPLGVVQHDETAGVQGPTFADPADSDTASPTVRNLFAAFETTHTSELGNDTDVAHFPGSPAIGYAHSALPVVVNTTINYGADFPAASAVFSLEVVNGTYSGVQTTDGHNIYLYNVDGFIVGRVGGTDAGHDDANPDGTIAFAITIEQSGNIDVAQYLSLHHGNTSSNDESISLTDGAIQAKLVVTDSDGDAVPATVDIGSHIRFDDDGPSLVGTNSTYYADEGDIVTLQAIGTSPNDGTHGNDGSYTGSKSGDIGAGPAVVSGSVAGAVNFGADGNGGFSFKTDAASTLAALGLTSNDGKLSYALIDGGHTIVAYVNQTILPGFPNSDYQPLVDRTIFTLSLDQTSGDFVFKLYDQLDHLSGNGNNTDLQGHDAQGNPVTVPGLDFGSLILATDGDGDSIALTGKLTIDVTDDTPQISAAVNPLGYVTIDESAGVQGLPANDTTSSSVTNRFALLESNHGAGGTNDLGKDTDVAHSPAGSPAIGYAYSLLPVVLVSYLNIGADFPAQSLVYSLQVTAGTYSGVQTTDGHNIYLYEDAATGLIVGRVGGDGAAHTDANPSGTIAFAIAIEQNGSIDVAQYLSLHHNDTNTNNESVSLTDGAIQAVVTVTDHDGDPATAYANVGGHIVFNDDGPKLVGTSATYYADEGDIVTPLAIGTSPNDGTHGDNNGSGQDGSYTGSPADNIVGPAVVSGSVAGAVDFGADGNGGFSFAAGAAATLAGLGLTSNDGKLSYALIDGGHTIVAYVNQTILPGFPNSDYQPLVDRTIFTLMLDPTTGDFTFKLYDQLDHVSGGGHNTDLQGANGPVSGLDFGSLIVATDGDGDHVTLDGKLTIDITDDTPQISAAVNPLGYVTIDESAGVQGLPANDTTNSAVRGRFAALESAHGTSGTHDLGNDPDIAHSPNVNSPAIGYAHSLGAVVLVTGLNIGADFPAQSLVYTLQVTAGIYSGVQTTDGHNIYLYKDDATGLIVGRVGGDGVAHTDANPNGTIAFAIAIEQDGSIDVAQYLSLHHNNTSSNNESIALTDGTIQAVVTVTDHDGDSTAAYANIGGHIVFNDDGPSAPTVNTTGAEPVLLTFDGGLAGNYIGSEGNGDGNLSPTIASVSFAGAFTVGNQHVYGADGPGQTVISYALHLKVSEGTDSHLTSGDQTIRLYEDNGVITGSTATSEGGITTANTIFTLSVDSSTGVVTLTQFHAVDQGAADSYDGGAYISDIAKLAAGLVELTASAYTTDGDGDKSATASKAIDLGDNVVFGDDGPKIVAGKTVVGEVDEDALTNHNTDSGQPGETHGATVSASASGTLAALVNFGADGGAGTGAGFHLVQQGPAATSYKSGNATVNIVVTQDGLIGFTGSDYTIAGNQVFTLVVGATGAYTFTLLKPMDHDPLTGQPGDDTENTLTIDLSGYVTATDGDGDHVDLGAGTFTVIVRDDMSVMSARDGVPTETTVTDTEPVTEHFTIKAGNVEARGLIGVQGDQGDHDLLLTATGGTVNTNNHDAAVGNQWIDSNSEILHLNFVTGLDSDNYYTATDPHSSAKFTITANGGKDSVVFIDATLGGSFVDLNFTGVSSAHVHKVYDGNGHPIGYVLDGVGSGSAITVSAAVSGGTFDVINVSNYSGVNFISDDGTHSYSGNKFHVGGIETTVTVQGTHTVTTPETFTVSEDESAGLNTASDPNAANDHAAPDALTNADAYAAIYDANAVGYAQSAESVLVTHGNFNALFTGSPGADGFGGWSFAITDKDGNAFGGATYSGLTTLNGTHILLTTDATTGALVGMAGADVVFKVYVDSDGYVWIAQYQAIHNDIAGSDLAAYDDIAKVTADLHITATLTDADGDSVTKTSPVSLSVQFQDDGPVAMNDELNLADHADGKGNVITGLNEVTPATSADTVGTDGAHVSAISGANTGTFDNTDNLFHVTGAHGTLTIDADGNYTYTRNPSDFASGTDTFTYELKDGDGDTATATLTIDLPQLTTPLVAGSGFAGTVEEEEFGNNGVQLSSSGRTGNEDVTGDGDTDTPVFHDNTTNVTTGALTVTGGTGPYTFAFAASGIEGTQATFGGEPATSNGKAVLFHIDSNNANTLIGYVENGTAGSGYDATADRVVFTLVINTDTDQTDASSGYIFTLYDNLDAKGAQVGDGVEGTQALSLNGLVVVTDIIGGVDHTVNVSGSVNVIDDIPIAIADKNAVPVDASSTTGNVLSDDAKGDHADTPGADGYASSGAVVGVSTNGSVVSDGTGLDSAGHTTGIAGQYGTLHLKADGSYEYDRTPGSQGGVDDVFTYTIKDGDGDLTHTTLTIHIDDSAPNLVLANGSQTDVYEAGLMGGRNLDPTESAGSQYGVASATASGTFNVTSTDGVASVTINGVTVNAGALTTVADSSTGTVHDDKGVLQAWYDVAAGQIHYTYTLTDNTLDTNGTTRNFDVVVTDNDGDVPSSATSLTINIVDDAPAAHADTDKAQSGETVTGNVETGVSTHGTGAADTAGADGIASITWNGTSTSGGVTTITGLHGVLTITNATGGYSYKAFANTTSGDDVFHYTITDGDGDNSPSTLTINVTNGQPQPVAATGQVDESGLATGSHAGDPAHPIATTAATLDLGDTDAPVVTSVTGTSATTIANSGNTIVHGTYGDLTIDAAGHYSYTLKTAEKNVPAGDNSTNIQNGEDVFTYTVQDAYGNTNTSTIIISIVDDVPTAHDDSASFGTAAISTSITGNVITGLENGATQTSGVDTQGADGAHVSAVSSDSNHTSTGTDTDATGGFDVTGAHGTLHVAVDGTYTYTRTDAAGGTDEFTYTLTDGDGDTDTAKLTISLDATKQLFVGSNDSDDNPSDPAHEVDPTPGTKGVINGSAGDDTIAGDPGGTTVIQAGAVANIVFVLDVSASMSTGIQGSTDRMTAMQNALKAALLNLSQSGAEDIRVHIVAFGLAATDLGTFDVRVGGVAQNLNAVNAVIDTLDNIETSGTNYEDGLAKAAAWINSTPDTASGPMSDATVNKVLFISDGEPNTWDTNAAYTTHNTPSSQNFSQTALDNVTGVADGTDERALITNSTATWDNAHPFTIEAIGINLSDATALAHLSVVEGTGGQATNVTTAQGLVDAVGTLATSTSAPTAAGSDTINGGAGNDIIYGDVMNTDVLRVAANLTTLQNGSGWAVFAELEAGHGSGVYAAWTRADTLAYIAAHERELAVEAGRTGGNDTITGGIGDDIIFAQEGNDTIYYALGDGRDIVDGGTGSDTLHITGATGNVTIAAAATGPDIVPATGPNYTDIIVTMSDGGTIRMDSVEDIIVDLGVGGGTVNYATPMTGTALDNTTVTVHGGSDNDTFDLTGRGTGGSVHSGDQHHVVYDGGANSAAGDTVILDFNISDITAVVKETSGGQTIGFDITHNGITDTFTNVENFKFADGTTATLSDLIATPAAPATLMLAVASDSGVQGDNTTNDTTPTIIGTAAAYATVTLYEGATVRGTATADGSGNWSIDSSTLGNGTHTLTATQTTVFGATSSISAGLPVTIDTTADAGGDLKVAITDASGYINALNASDIHYTVTGLDADATATVTFKASNGATTTISGLGAGDHEIDLSGFVDGSITATITATDAAANSATGTGDTSSKDVVSPTVTINQAATQADPGNGSVHFTVTFSEAVTAADFTASDILLTGAAAAGLTNSNILITGSGTTYDVAVSGFTQAGDLIASVIAGAAKDTAGNASLASTSTDHTVTVTLDQPPSDIVFSGNTGLTTSNLSASSVLLTASAVDPDDTTGFVYGFYNSGGMLTSTQTNNGETFSINSSTGVITSSTNAATGKTYTLVVDVADSHGAHYHETVSLILGTTNGDTLGSSSTSNDQVIYGFGGFDTITGGSGNDFLVGGGVPSNGNGTETISGGAGNDSIVYEAGTNSNRTVVLDGGADNDTLVIIGSSGLPTVNLDNASDQTTNTDYATVKNFENVDASGVTSAISITGSSVANILIGGSQGDTLVGGGGVDTLTGGGGADHFRFNALSELGDHIVDFSGSTGTNHQNDVIELLGTAFGGVAGNTVSWNTNGSLNETIYQGTDAATKTLSGSQHFAYDSSTGSLYYDANGGTADANRILLAILDNHATLTATDIHKV